MSHPPLPLEGILVLEFSQYLAGPYCGLRLADLGAEVIKIERPGSGDACRQLATKNMIVDGDSLVFHTINRNKKSFAANLKDPSDLAKVKELITRADVITHNFRPGVMEKIGLDWETVRQINPRLVYGEVSGYGKSGPWRDFPGQDLLAQSRSGLTWLNGNADNPPTPFGLAIADMICGTHLAQGILAALANKSPQGCRIEVSLLESIIDLQFELFTTYFHNGQQLPVRAKKGNAHPYLGSPYGIYETADSYLAIAMCDLQKLGRVIGCEGVKRFAKAEEFSRRTEIYEILSSCLSQKPTAAWLALLDKEDLWCADVLDYERLFKHEAFEVLHMKQTVKRDGGVAVDTTRCPIRIDRRRLFSDTAAPRIGADNAYVESLLARKPASPTETNGAKANEATLPLAGIKIVDFSQFLSGPSASLRLADLGAEVIKVEHPTRGDLCRSLYVSDTEIEGESTLFHAINRNKKSVSLDLNSPAGIEKVLRLIEGADVVMSNFRPGVMQRFGLDYETLKQRFPQLVYGQISGYGTEGPWRDKPGQDLLVQALSGLTQFTGNRDSGPVPFGVAAVDILAGAQLAQGLLACLARKNRTGQGGIVEVNMLESSLDLQFEPLTIYWQDGGQPVERSATHNAHPLVGAPYGVYQTSDGYLALAMANILQIGELIGCAPLSEYTDPKSWFAQRDAIKAILASHLKAQSTQHWLDILQPADIWCSEVLDYKGFTESEAYRVLGLEQSIHYDNKSTLHTTCCPIRLNGKVIRNKTPAPRLGQHQCLLNYL
ncbi:CoA transferase [Pelagicoccus sp. SDUM812003]|uniref:CaiB/BaiF CoA transferase family protein n=1 Tax=Pelagicoccus sp. SDUM812003 TaxID=3041267 RepID=UPI00280D018B|nr:CoA transferase [Pelagicoccus sp. SDUM812003]MDQ8201411.1 CoA transferase [Pelagicoccus sp. SDUM812003]